MNLVTASAQAEMRIDAIASAPGAGPLKNLLADVLQKQADERISAAVALDILQVLAATAGAQIAIAIENNCRFSDKNLHKVCFETSRPICLAEPMQTGMSYT